MKKDLQVIGRIAELLINECIPFLDVRIPAGFPSPAFDFSEERIDLNELLVNDKESTYIATVHGVSMIDAHILPGSFLVVDRSIIPNSGDIIVAIVYGDYMVKIYKVENGRIWLVPANKTMHPMEITEAHEFMIWGVVTRIIINPKIRAI